VTLYLTPVVYTYMAHLQEWMERGKKKSISGELEHLSQLYISENGSRNARHSFGTPLV
jgi:hypothetical protein